MNRQNSMSFRNVFGLGSCIVLLILAAFVLWPQMDLAVSGLFYRPTDGFFLRDIGVLLALNDLAVYGSRFLGGLLLIATVVAFFRHGFLAKISTKTWLFLFVGLVVGPGLIANVVFKDHWGRARPREIVEFGGAATFTPPLVMAQECDKNCSFVAGDGAFGFYLSIFAYSVAPSKRRRVLGGLVVVGAVFAIARILMGAHFLSDVLYAMVFMFLSNAGLHSVFFGRAKTLSFWKHIIKGDVCVEKT